MRFQEVKHHEIPDAYARQTLARAEAVFGREEPDFEAMAYWSEQEEALVREEWQNERAEQHDRFIDYSDVDAPEEWWVSLPSLTLHKGA